VREIIPRPVFYLTYVVYRLFSVARCAMSKKDYSMSQLMEKTQFDHFHPVEYLDHLDSDGEVADWTEEEEKAVRRKIDVRIVPLVTLLYLLCFVWCCPQPLPRTDG
jgi:hypothetical protein